jgi:hypothetical protein
MEGSPKRRGFWLAILLAGWLFPVPAQDQNEDAPPAPCEREAAYAQFDFWVGEWDVYDPEGKHVGRNRIEKQHRSCLLLENWTGDSGGKGTSINFYHPGDGEWHQIWVDGQGRIIEAAAKFTDGAMRFEGEMTRSNGTRLDYRMTFTPDEEGRVRQLIELLSPEGEGWQLWFDGTYVRHEGAN